MKVTMDQSVPQKVWRAPGIPKMIFCMPWNLLDPHQTLPPGKEEWSVVKKVLLPWEENTRDGAETQLLGTPPSQVSWGWVRLLRWTCDVKKPVCVGSLLRVTTQQLSVLLEAQPSEGGWGVTESSFCEGLLLPSLNQQTEKVNDSQSIQLSKLLLVASSSLHPQILRPEPLKVTPTRISWPFWVLPG